MATQDLAFWLLGISLIVHTIEEAWLPEWQRVRPNWQAAIFNRSLFLDNLTIFIFAIILAAIGWRWPIISGILPAIGLTHPIFDHVGLSWKAGHIRPGSLTGLFLFFPLSIWVYVLAERNVLFQLYELIVSGVIGLAISMWLVWIVVQEQKAAN